ncbi:MAG: alpha/beta fold hydrolase, partial [Actinophytocola sp.]|nr:alpha/beta fold hydrolase [Actinophytocola sp.]
TGDLSSITTRTLVIAGAQDPATPPAHAELIAEAITGARLEVLDPAAHLANLEQAERFNALLLEHLADGRENG